MILTFRMKLAPINEVVCDYETAKIEIYKNTCITPKLYKDKRYLIQICIL